MIMKKLGIIVGIIVVIVVMLLVFKNILIKVALEEETKKVTGLQLTVGSIDVGLFTPKVDITDIRLFNPPGFSDKVMIDIPKFFISFELASFFKNRAHFRTVELNLNELMVVRNKERKLNLDALTALGEKKQQGEKPVEQKEAKQEKKPMQLTVDKLMLKIGRVVYKDYSLGATPFTKTFTIGINEVFKNVTDPNDLVKLIIVRALEGTTIAQLANFNLGALKGDVADTLQGGVSGLTEAGQKALGTTGGTATKETGKKTGGLIKGLEKQLK
jgi:uncharacterized protein involved in outer membrane biogenesis